MAGDFVHSAFTEGQSATQGLPLDPSGGGQGCCQIRPPRNPASQFRLVTADHQREVAVAAIAGPEQVLDQPFELLIAESLAKVTDELLFLARPHLIQVVVVWVGSSRG